MNTCSQKYEVSIIYWSQTWRKAYLYCEYFYSQKAFLSYRIGEFLDLPVHGKLFLPPWTKLFRKYLRKNVTTLRKGRRDVIDAVLQPPPPFKNLFFFHCGQNCPDNILEKTNLSSWAGARQHLCIGSGVMTLCFEQLKRHWNRIIYLKLELLFLNGTNRSAGPTVAFKLALYMSRSILYSSTLTAHKHF